MRVTRGITKAPQLKASSQISVEFDQYGRPHGGHIKEFKLWITAIARSGIGDINCRSWRDVPLERKNTIWMDVKSHFNLDEDLSKKSYVLRKVARSWADMKYAIKKEWIDNNPKRMRKNKKTPWELGYCTKEEFNVYKEFVLSKSFQAKSAKGKASKERDKHPHFMGSRSYAQNEPIWRKEGEYPILVQSSNDDIGLIRVQNWKNARIKRDPITSQKYFPHEQTREVCHTMDTLIEEVGQGHFIPTGQDDILNRALEKKEITGRTKGIGCTVGVTRTFGKGSSNKSSQVFNDQMKANLITELTEKLTATLTEKVRAEMMSLMAQWNFQPSASTVPLVAPQPTFVANQPSSSPIPVQCPSSATLPTNVLVDPIVMSARRIRARRSARRKVC